MLLPCSVQQSCLSGAAGVTGMRVFLKRILCLFLLLCLSTLSVSFGLEEMRAVVAEGEGEYAEEAKQEEQQEELSFQASTPPYSLHEIQEVLETWWPSSAVFDFDAALHAARRKAKKPLGLWGIETIDRKELVRLLNLEMERFVAKQYALIRQSDSLLKNVPLLGDWDVLLLVRQQLTRDRVKTKLTDKEINDIFMETPRLYPWLPKDACDWRPPTNRTLYKQMLPTCTIAEQPDSLL